MDYSVPVGSRWKLAPGSLTSGGDHLYSERPPLHQRLASDSGHLRPGGLPATVAITVRTKRSSLSSSYGVRTRPSKNAAATSTAYDVLYDPPDGVGTVRPAARGMPRMWRTCARRDHRPCGGRTATPRSAAGDSIRGGTKAIKSKEMEPQHGSLPTPRYWGVRGMEPWLSPLPTSTRLVIILLPEC
jgi:hypothetical protein